MLSEEIKENTKTNHQTLEKKMIGKMRSIESKDDYANFLAIFYSYFGGLELAINKHLDSSVLPDYGQRRKTAALVDDLGALGHTLPTLAVDGSLPEIENHYQALGALYVIEGSTLGGRIICKMLSKQMDFIDDSVLSFFNGYGEQTDSMWQVFKQTMDLPANEQQHETIINAANQTFLHFGEWFDNN
ncbi:biliverdin-producing heme oxygenase [Pedobacter sp.]|uniref:biliverdin-producing heme oxygenase n=1 Tax=Pedobacter sp. TaxID=1411316 RepID=UPI003D7F701C